MSCRLFPSLLPFYKQNVTSIFNAHTSNAEASSNTELSVFTVVNFASKQVKNKQTNKRKIA